MRILSRYLIQRFLAILFYTTIAFIAIFIIVDLIERLDKFLSHDATFTSLFLYYTYYIPYIILLTLPVNMLLSTLFSIGMMAQHNEIIACHSAAISLYRIILPILTLGLLISIISGAAAEVLVPKTNKKRLDIWRYDIRKEQKQILHVRQRLALQDENNRQIYISSYDGSKKRANQVSIIWMKNERISKRVDAKSMSWDEKNTSWKLSDVTERQMSDSGEVIQRQDSYIYGDTKIFPEDLLELQTKPEEMNYAELSRFVDRMLEIGADERKWLVDLYMKISYPFSNFIIVLFGAPLAARKRRSGPALGFAIALLISFIFFLFLRVGQVLGHKGDLEPWLAAWIGNMVFGIGGIIVMIKARK